MKRNLKAVLFTAAGSAALIGANAHAGGFEKNVLWGAKEVGMGGAAVSTVNGPDALFFNPAGLATGRTGTEVSGNFSPTWGKFSGPIYSDNVTVDGNTTFSPVFGVLAMHNITPQWGIGIGAYASAGTKAVYDNVSFAPIGYSIAPTVKSDVYTTEFAIGTGYEVLPGFKVGADWRVVLVHASFATVTQTTSAIVASDLEDLSDTRWNGFRVGGQYRASDNKWGLGITWRTAVDFAAEGTVSGQANPLAAPTTVTTLTGGPASAGSSLPSQIAAGGDVALTDSVRFHGEYVWTQYQRNQVLALGGTLGGSPLTSIPLNWSNQTNLRAGLECTALPDWTFRAGYVWTSQVVPNEVAKPNLSSPGHGTTLTAGAGTQFLNKQMDVDLALEYSWAGGTGTAPAKLGDYSSHDFAPHLSVAYRF